MLIAAGADRFDAAAFPDRFTSGGVELPLDYVFDPGRGDDGVTVSIPLRRARPGRPGRLRGPDPRPASRSRCRADPHPAEDAAPQLRAGTRLRQGRVGPQSTRAGPLADELAAALTPMTGVVVRPATSTRTRSPSICG